MMRPGVLIPEQDIGAQASKWQFIADIIISAIRQLKPTGIDIDVNVGEVEIFADPLIEKIFHNLMENSPRHGENVTYMDYSVRENKRRSYSCLL